MTWLVGWVLRAVALLFVARAAYEIRLYAINEYGRVIHEFDPWFNYRATEYLAQHGVYDFFHWFDHRSWYPLGRPVGTTIYPGMQLSSVGIWKALNWLGDGFAMSLNDVCCFVPAWFGVIASMFLGLLAAECSGSPNSGVAAAAIMSVIPAHIMRSVGGGYDNESVAFTAMCSTFYFWCRSLRDEEGAWKWGFATGLAYVYMAAAWGGFVFVLNMIVLHAGFLVLIGRFSFNLRNAYTLFYVVGTLGAMQIPVVGSRPLKSLEQLGGLAGLVGLHVLGFCESYRLKHGGRFSKEVLRFYTKVFGGVAAVGLAVIVVLLPMGYFGPISSRVRGLFIKHTRTGNPLVDSVAEHQPAPPEAYVRYLHNIRYLAPIGFALSFYKRTDAKFFLVAYACLAYNLSTKMMRLLVLLGPIAAALGGITVGYAVDWMIPQLLLPVEFLGFLEEEKENETPVAADDASSVASEVSEPETSKKSKKQKHKKVASKAKTRTRDMPAFQRLKLMYEKGWEKGSSLFFSVYDLQLTKVVRFVVALLLIYKMAVGGREFFDYCHQMAQGLSHPSIMYKARLRDGSTIMVDDYRQAYWWLRDNTPEDARVLSWWDYGYQISGIANRTTLADGNTWNHEQIATIGYMLTSPEKRAHRLIRHLADYVLVWAGGGGDDLAKSPHLRRIANSVYDGVCPGDPVCSNYGFVNQNYEPTPAMAVSLLYKLHRHNHAPGVQVDASRFREVFTSKYGKVRIYKVVSISTKSRDWAADPTNRHCDAPGSWYCPGTYPPAFTKLMDKMGIKRKAFQQHGDFNAQRDEKAREYEEAYLARMEGRAPPPKTSSPKRPKAKKPAAAEKEKSAKPSPPAAAKSTPTQEEFVPEESDRARNFAEKMGAKSTKARRSRLKKLQAKLDQEVKPDRQHWLRTRIHILQQQLGKDEL